MRDTMTMKLEERIVEVNRSQLLTTLIKNKEKHQKEYQESLAGYQQLAQERLNALQVKATKNLTDNFVLVSKKIEQFNPEDVEPLQNVITLIQSMSFNLKVPQNHSRSYDVAIEMAKWDVRETIELTQGQFQCFVLDDWDWQQEFTHLNKLYSHTK